MLLCCEVNLDGKDHEKADNDDDNNHLTAKGMRQRRTWGVVGICRKWKIRIFKSSENYLDSSMSF